MPTVTRRLPLLFALGALAIAAGGCKPSVPAGQVRPAGTGSSPAPSSNFKSLDGDNSSTTAGGAGNGSTGKPAGGS